MESNRIVNTAFDKEGTVVGLGEVLWDMLPEGRKLGGAPANFAYHASQFGFPACVASAVGNDSLGNEIAEQLSSKGLETAIPEVPFPTGTVRVEIDSEGIPRYDIREGAAWDHIPFTDDLEKLARHARAVCFGTLAQRSPESRETILRFLDSIPAGNGCLIVFDINLRQDYYDKDVIIDSLRRCDILKINDEELETVSKMLSLPDTGAKERCMRLIDDYGLRGVILTCGTRGSFAFSRESASFMPTPEVEVADTVGAGDSFTGAFVASLLKGESFEDAHRRAVAVSAYVCTQPGAMPPLPPELIG